jgi:hypothetical protein
MTHLSSAQISEWILGEHDKVVKQHVQTCSKCYEEIARLQDGLLAFRQSMRDWAEQPAVPGVVSSPPHRVSWGWAAGSAAIIFAALLPMYLDVREAQHEAKIAQDSLLLNQVQSHLTRAVPQPMEHLMDLMNERTTEGKEDPQ